MDVCQSIGIVINLFTQKNLTMRTINRTIKYLAICFLAVAIFSCQGNNSRMNNDDQTEMSEDFQNERTAFKNEIEQRINKIDKDIERINRKMEERADNVSEEVEEEWAATKAKLQEWKTELQNEADKTENVLQNEWAEFKSNVEETMENAEEEFDRLGEKIKDFFTIEDNQ